MASVALSEANVELIVDPVALVSARGSEDANAFEAMVVVFELCLDAES